MSQFRLVDTPETKKRLNWITAMVGTSARFALNHLPLTEFSPAERQYLSELKLTGVSR